MADRRDAGARTVPTIAAGVVAGVAALVLLGWLLDSEPLKAVIAGRSTMKPNTAIAFVLAAVSLWLQRGSPADPLERRVALGCAAAVAALGLVTLADYWFAWDPGIARWVFPASPDAVTPFPGRMGINTATCFALLGTGLLGLRAPVVRLRRTAEACAAVITVIALFALVGHLFGVQPLTPLTLGMTQMAAHTGALLLFMSAGLLAASPDGWTVRVLGGEGPGGSAARRLVPTVFAALLVISWLRLWGQQAGLFGTEFGVAIVVVTSVVILTLAVIVNAAQLDRGTALQRRAEARFRVVVESAPSGMVMVDRTGKIVLVNREAERLFGYTREEMLSQPIEHLVPERFRRGHPVFRTDFFANPQTRAMGAGRELYGLRQDGVEIPVEIGLNPIETDEGFFVLASVVDITARKRAEQRFRAVVESAPSGMVMMNRAGTIELVNREAERLFGYAREELLGKPIELLVPHRLRERHPGYRIDFFANPQTRAMGAGRDLYGVRKDGTEVPVEIGLNPIETEEGLFVLASVVDITARKRAEARFRAAVESAPSGMVMIDRAGKIILVNREIERLFGHTRDELLGQSIELLVPRRLRERHPGHRADFFANPQTRAMGAGRDLYGVRKDGTEVPVEIGLNPIETDDGTFVLASVVDITERKRAENELHRSNEELERFAYVASHDLQEPLRMVGSYVQLLGKRYKGQLDADADEFIGYALDGALRMQRLIEDLLAFSRVGTRGQALAPTDADSALDRALESLKLATDDTGATITRDGLPTVTADAGPLEHLFLNLLTNALKFRGSSPPEIRIAA